MRIQGTRPATAAQLRPWLSDPTLILQDFFPAFTPFPWGWTLAVAPALSCCLPSPLSPPGAAKPHPATPSTPRYGAQRVPPLKWPKLGGWIKPTARNNEAGGCRQGFSHISCRVILLPAPGLAQGPVLGWAGGWGPF